MQPISLAGKSPHMKVMSEPITLEGQKVADAKAMKAFREGDMSYYCYLIWFSQSVKPTTLEGHEIADTKAMKASKEGDMSYYCYSIWFAQSVPYSSMLFFSLDGWRNPREAKWLIWNPRETWGSRENWNSLASILILGPLHFLCECLFFSRVICGVTLAWHQVILFSCLAEL